MKVINLKKPPTLGLAMIAKDCPESLAKCLESCKAIGFDEIVVVDTGSGSPATLEVATKYGATTYKWEDPDPDFLKANGFISSFAAARNFSFEKSTTDYVMWIDADDVIYQPEKLKGLFLQEAARHENPAIALSYYYSKDKRGNWNTVLKRIRIVKKDQFYWEGTCHEDLLAKQMEQVKFLAILPGDCRVEHDIEAKDGSAHHRDKRNVAILENELTKNGGLDPRLWKHLGQGYEGIGKVKEAIKCYERALVNSNWNEDIYINLTNIGGCYRQLDLPNEAVKFDLRATEVCPEYPNAWVFLALDQNRLRNHKKALFYTDIALSCKEISDTLGLNPSGMRCALYAARHEAYRELGQTQLALDALKEIEHEYPDVKQYENNVKAFEQCLKDADVYRAFRRVGEALIEEGDFKKLDDMLHMAPKCIMDYPDFQFLKKAELPLDRPTMAIVCPGDGWGAKSLEKGIGGSEEAVICLSKELAKLGVWVDVYTNTPWEGEHDGVHWYPFHALRPNKDYYDHVVIWRYTRLIDSEWNCQTLSIWLHDLQFENHWTQQQIDRVDKVIFLSKYQRDTAPWIPEEKVIISRNGLAPEYFAEPKNDPKRVCFTSNPLRGLGEVLKIWPEIHKETGATLHTYYGFTEITKQDLVTQPIASRHMAEVQKLMAVTPGIVNHGMVGQKELCEENAKAGIWFYPTRFPEISCISAMRAQAHGAIPICSDFAALNETVQHGIKLKTDENLEANAKAELIALIKDPDRQAALRGPMIEWARQAFPWSDVAKFWVEALGIKTWDRKPTVEASPLEEVVISGNPNMWGNP